MHINKLSEKEIKRNEYNLIRNSNSLALHKTIKSMVKIELKTLIKKYHKEDKFIGIYWPLKGEVDITFLKEINNLKIALPSSSKKNGINYHYWSKDNLEPDSNNIPAPLKERSLNPNEISILFVPAIAIDKDGFRLGYGGGYFDRLRKNNIWFSIPSFIIISQNCVSMKQLPRDEWDLPFNGWISEKGLHQIEAPK